MSWPIGREAILQMLDAGELEMAPPNRPFADTLIGKAFKHLTTAEDIAATDPEIAFDALYTAARLALTAVLATQGIRPTAKGGHIAPIAAVRAQTGRSGDAQLRPYDRLRRIRNRTDYPTPESILTSEDVAEALPHAAAIVDVAAKLLPQLPVFVR
ncbi:uncharacterized protein (UPF0332 family) [Nakamurella sp. UYEF19]|uniref:HEPN domain-containing protein n=1 Tax=Nakamurella sp. UYEF19 TaxID=1756392 RepID=UPI003399CE9F